MEDYSRETRIELTPLGWLYLANRRLRKKSKLEREATATALEERAETAIRAGLKGVEANQLVAPLQ